MGGSEPLLGDVSRIISEKTSGSLRDLQNRDMTQSFMHTGATPRLNLLAFPRLGAGAAGAISARTSKIV